MIIKEDLIKSRYMIELDKYIDEVYSKDLNPNRRVFKDGKSIIRLFQQFIPWSEKIFTFMNELSSQ